MPVKLTLQKLSDWITDSAKAAKGATDLALASGLLRESLDELCDLGGVAGALFKLGSRAIPDPTPEQRIAAKLHRTFLAALDHELQERADLIGKKTWKTYTSTRLAEVASFTLWRVHLALHLR